jgi:hypothetical protein
LTFVSSGEFQGRVTDHRINVTKFGMDSMMSGGDVFSEFVDDLQAFTSMQALSELYGIEVRLVWSAAFVLHFFLLKFRFLCFCIQTSASNAANSTANKPADD